MDIQERIDRYLVDAHAIEEQALQQLERAPDVAGDPEFSRILREHRLETEGHEQRVRAELERRGRSPNRFVDTVMKAGGDGFVLFAESQTDTPGKLAAHALSYEALEWASYDLLARTAERAGDTRLATVARGIRDEERHMMERIERLFDRTVEASFAEARGDDIQKHLNHYLADAHALEAQSIELLEQAAKMVEAPALVSAFEEHLRETRTQQEVIETRLRERDARPSFLKDAALRIGGFNWAMFFRAQPDTPGKLTAFVYACEFLEVGGYEQLRRVAARAGDDATMTVVLGILQEERQAASRISGLFEDALDETLADVVDGSGAERA